MLSSQIDLYPYVVVYLHQQNIPQYRTCCCLYRGFYNILFCIFSNINFDFTWANKITSIVFAFSAIYSYARRMSQEVILEIATEVIIFNILCIVVVWLLFIKTFYDKANNVPVIYGDYIVIAACHLSAFPRLIWTLNIWKPGENILLLWFRFRVEPYLNVPPVKEAYCRLKSSRKTSVNQPLNSFSLSVQLFVQNNYGVLVSHNTTPKTLWEGNVKDILKYVKCTE